MSDSKATSPPDGPSGDDSRPAASGAGLPPSHDDTNGPGMTNGVPDAASSEEATGAPDSDRHRSETAGNPDRQDERGG